MILGQVNARFEAKVGLVIEYGNGATQPFEATIDTGFTGSLTLPPSLVATLGLVWLHYRDIQLVDGSVARMSVYSATIIWDGQHRKVDVYAVDSDALVGLKLLAGNEVRMRLVDGGQVWIDSLP
jgi:clan AA aspartic protease